MTTFLLIVILASIAAVAILVVYLIDRVNTLQRLTRLLQSDPATPAADPDTSGPFGDLVGQRLWEALVGIPTEGWDATAIELIRNRYGLVLRKHIEDIFYEGQTHARGGIQQPPSASRTVRTLRGTVESWIPVEHAMTIYKAGWDRVSATAETLPTIRNTLDAAVAGLYSAVSIKLARPMSEHLIPTDPQEMAALALGMDTSTAGVAGALPGQMPALSGVVTDPAQAPAQLTSMSGADRPPAPSQALPDKAGAGAPSLLALAGSTPGSNSPAAVVNTPAAGSPPGGAGGAAVSTVPGQAAGQANAATRPAK